MKNNSPQMPDSGRKAPVQDEDEPTTQAGEAAQEVAQRSALRALVVKPRAIETEADKATKSTKGNQTAQQSKQRTTGNSKSKGNKASKLSDRTTKPAQKKKSACKEDRRKKRAKKNALSKRKRVLLWVLEIGGLVVSALILIIALLGQTAGHLNGVHFFTSILPFALTVLAMALVAALALLAWRALRRKLLPRSPWVPPLLALSLALTTAFLPLHSDFRKGYSELRTLIGGREEAARVNLAHQVFAAYRRSGTSHFQKMVVRSQPYQDAVIEAAQAFALDSDLLCGIAATESSFQPRTSADGGQGLFQITSVPAEARNLAAKHLTIKDASQLVLSNPRHNAFVAAATFSLYLQQMRGDLFLGLLAYNIGPANGGLRFIMQQYGVNDFVGIQPYLQQLPRDYPIRVLSHALAFRLWRSGGRIPAYEEGVNAVRIQHIGIPGL